MEGDGPDDGKALSNEELMAGFAYVDRELDALQESLLRQRRANLAMGQDFMATTRPLQDAGQGFGAIVERMSSGRGRLRSLMERMDAAFTVMRSVIERDIRSLDRCWRTWARIRTGHFLTADLQTQWTPIRTNCPIGQSS